MAQQDIDMLTDQIFASSIDKQAYLARYPSQFWDGLSETPLNDCALEHVCRMTSQRRDEAKAVPQAPTRQQMADHEKDFAKAGGPDFAFLRAATANIKTAVNADAHFTRQIMTKALEGGAPLNVANEMIYGEHFGQYLSDHSIHAADLGARPSNYAQLQMVVLSPENISQHTSHMDFVACHSWLYRPGLYNADSLINMLGGKVLLRCEQSLDNLYPLVNSLLPHSHPDLVDGELAAHLYQGFLADETLCHNIVGTKDASDPNRIAAMNFFLKVVDENEGENERIAVVQMAYEAAHGARAMHVLRNYRQGTKVYDVATTYSAIYNWQTDRLRIFAHHVSEPAHPWQRDEYHMTTLFDYKLGWSADDCVTVLGSLICIIKEAEVNRQQLLRRAEDILRQQSE